MSNQFDREIEEIREKLKRNKGKGNRRTLQEKIQDVKGIQRIKELRRLKEKTKVYKKKYRKKNTLYIPINTRKKAEVIDRLDEEMNLLIEQKRLGNEDIIKALDACNGNIAKTAKVLNLYESTLYRKVKQDPEIKEHMEIISQRIIDMAKDVLKKKLEEDDPRVATFILETKGKDEGFHKKLVKEISGKDGGAIKIEDKTKQTIEAANNTILRSIKGVM